MGVILRGPGGVARRIEARVVSGPEQAESAQERQEKPREYEAANIDVEKTLAEVADAYMEEVIEDRAGSMLRVEAAQRDADIATYDARNTENPALKRSFEQVLQEKQAGKDRADRAVAQIDQKMERVQEFQQLDAEYADKSEEALQSMEDDLDAKGKSADATKINRYRSTRRHLTDWARRNDMGVKMGRAERAPVQDAGAERLAA